MEYISNSEQDTINLGKMVASQLKVGDIVILTGDLGSGKTKFTEGVLTYFNLQNEISSPTFTIVNEYDTPNLKIFHFDVYRLEDSDEFSAIGGEEYFERGASIIEWGEMIEDCIPQNYLKLTFSRNEEFENRRVINIEKVGNIDINIDLD
jgi:tRNA threonylcarbamoyladenosine biosynthesis protein TsaE